MKKDNNIITLNSKQSTSRVVSDSTISLSEVKQKISYLEDLIHQTMVEGIDYGKVAGYNKPTLLKPGAEKICQYMNLSINYEVSHRFEDWQNGMFYCEVRVVLIQIGTMHIVAEGIGSCNTKEEQYADQTPFTIINTVLKMAKKRALVDAVLNVSASSGFFTQDVEDMPSNKDIKGGDGTITRRQLTKIHQLVKEQDMNPDTAREMMKMMFNVDHSTKLSKTQASSFIKDLLLLSEVQGGE
ncbi:hypothetical protein [Sediminibacillus sp. JSM 1682029]|uniref:hypothetical protein n=1 Tax=Sediminibacillus sp. JSM 1682029 TaxID=3229857 RepID=UPI00352605D5